MATGGLSKPNLEGLKMPARQQQLGQQTAAVFIQKQNAKL